LTDNRCKTRSKGHTHP